MTPRAIKILKWTLIALNVGYFISGYHIIYENYDVAQRVRYRPELAPFMNLPNYLTYALGSVIIITSLFGVFAAYKENSLLLKIYAALILVGLLSQISINVLFYRAYPNVTKYLAKEILIERYDFKTKEDRSKIQEIQQAHACCGVFGPSDYNGTFSNLPNSCCGKYNPQKENTVRRPYTGGLFDPEVSKDAFLNHGDCTENEVKYVPGCGNLFLAELREHTQFTLYWVYLFFAISYLAQVPSLVISLVLSHKIVQQFMV